MAAVQHDRYEDDLSIDLEALRLVNVSTTEDVDNLVIKFSTDVFNRVERESDGISIPDGYISEIVMGEIAGALLAEQKANAALNENLEQIARVREWLDRCIRYDLAKIEELEKKNNELEEKNNKLEKEMTDLKDKFTALEAVFP